MGLCARRVREIRGRLRNAGAGHSSGAAAIWRLRAGAPSRAALRPHAQRPRLFLGSAGDPRGGMGGGAAGRARADSVTRLHPDNDGELAAAPVATAWPIGFRSRRWRPSSRPSWSGLSLPKPIAWHSQSPAEHETKCMFRRFPLDWLKNMHYCASNEPSKSLRKRQRVAHGR